jgi:hypothetical protein
VAWTSSAAVWFVTSTGCAGGIDGLNTSPAQVGGARPSKDALNLDVVRVLETLIIAPVREEVTLKLFFFGNRNFSLECNRWCFAV